MLVGFLNIKVKRFACKCNCDTFKMSAEVQTYLKIFALSYWILNIVMPSMKYLLNTTNVYVVVV